MKKTESFHSGWIGEIDEELLNDNFKKIFMFYVIETPCKNVSSREKYIKDTWGERVWRNTGPNGLRARLLEQANLVVNNNYIVAKKMDDMSNILALVKLNNNFQSKLLINKIAFYKNKEAEFENIFFYIRCSLAHGRFHIKKNNMDEIYYIMETGDHKKRENKVELKARMVIKEQTLIDWINIINNKE